MGLWADFGTFVRDLTGAEPPTFNEDGSLNLDYDPENWTDNYWDDFIGNLEDTASKLGDSATNILGDIGDTVDGTKAVKQNAFLQYLANNFTDEQRIATEKYNSLEADKAYGRQVELQKMAQEFNSNQAELNRLWQTQMSNTAYQRAVADMREAGLNPYLAYAQGGAPMTSSQSASVGVSASPTASSSSRSGASASVGNTANGVVGVIGSFLSSISRLLG